MMFPKNNALVSKKLRDSARGEVCTFNVVGVCNYNPETTVLAHLPVEIAGTKSTDLSAAFACSDCHDWLDRRSRSPCADEDREFYMRRANIRTLHRWKELGLLRIA